MGAKSGNNIMAATGEGSMAGAHAQSRAGARREKQLEEKTSLLYSSLGSN